MKGVPVTDTQKSCGCHTLTIDCDCREGCQKIIERITDADYAAIDLGTVAGFSWLQCQEIAEQKEVDAALEAFSQDSTFDNATGLVQAIATALAAAPQANQALQKYDDVLIPFLSMMRAELHANAGKGDRPGWLRMDAKTALLEIYYHLGKLQKATKGGDPDGIREFSADVANMAMMLADICGVLSEQPSPAAPDATEQGRTLWARQCDLDESDPALFVARERVEESGYTVPFFAEPRPQAAPDVAGLVEALKEARRELDSCQRVIHYAGGFDPAYVDGAQKALCTIDAALAAHQEREGV